MQSILTVSGVTGSWTYGYDSANRLLTTLNPYGETATNVYDVANRLTSTTNGNASVSTFGYDNANRTTSVTHSTSSSATLASYQYTYDSASNVSSRTDSDGTVTTFGYDSSDQLTSEVRDNSHSTGYSIAFVYDHNGNRTSKVQNGVTTTYSYDNHDKLTAAGSKTYGYDLNGNCTTVSVGTNTTTLTYDIENRVVGIAYPGGGSNSFAYNGDDLRTQKVDSSGTQNYVTDGSSPASAVLKDGNAVYTPGLSERRGSASKFYHGDALGSTRGITDSTQAVTDSQLYDAFGNTMSKTGTTPTPFGFVGKAQYQSDSDSGLQLLGHRYYDPSLGRFLSSDPIQAGDNWYAYCDNNPLKRTDPEGLQAKGPAVGYKPGYLDGVSGSWPIYKDGSVGDFIPDHPGATDPKKGHDRGRNTKTRGGVEHSRVPKGGGNQSRGGRHIAMPEPKDYFPIMSEPYYPPPPNAWKPILIGVGVVAVIGLVGTGQWEFAIPIAAKLAEQF